MTIEYANQDFFKTFQVPFGHAPRDYEMQARLEALEAAGVNPVAPTSLATIINVSDPFATDPELPTAADFQATADLPAINVGDTIAYTTPDGNTWVSHVRDDGNGNKIVTPPVQSGQITEADGATEIVVLGAVAQIEPRLDDGWVRRYIITATAPITQEVVDGTTYNVVEFPVIAAPATNHVIEIQRPDNQEILLNIAGQDNILMNFNPERKNSITLTSVGGVWLLGET